MYCHVQTRTKKSTELNVVTLCLIVVALIIGVLSPSVHGLPQLIPVPGVAQAAQAQEQEDMILSSSTVLPLPISTPAIDSSFALPSDALIVTSSHSSSSSSAASRFTTGDTSSSPSSTSNSSSSSDPSSSSEKENDDSDDSDKKNNSSSNRLKSIILIPIIIVGSLLVVATLVGWTWGRRRRYQEQKKLLVDPFYFDRQRSYNNSHKNGGGAFRKLFSNTSSKKQQHKRNRSDAPLDAPFDVEKDGILYHSTPVQSYGDGEFLDVEEKMSWQGDDEMTNETEEHGDKLELIENQPDVARGGIFKNREGGGLSMSKRGMKEFVASLSSSSNKKNKGRLDKTLPRTPATHEFGRLGASTSSTTNDDLFATARSQEYYYRRGSAATAKNPTTTNTQATKTPTTRQLVSGTLKQKEWEQEQEQEKLFKERGFFQPTAPLGFRKIKDLPHDSPGDKASTNVATATSSGNRTKDAALSRRSTSARYRQNSEYAIDVDKLSSHNDESPLLKPMKPVRIRVSQARRAKRDKIMGESQGKNEETLRSKEAKTTPIKSREDLPDVLQPCKSPVISPKAFDGNATILSSRRDRPKFVVDNDEDQDEPLDEFAKVLFPANTTKNNKTGTGMIKEMQGKGKATMEEKETKVKEWQYEVEEDALAKVGGLIREAHKKRAQK